ncbi:DUF1566 domain-containing protein [Desulfobacterales bacterium HSG16]|nr:DUF1566 domain-containing protein [Desulfobacterales bacterium HSG16]
MMKKNFIALLVILLTSTIVHAELVDNNDGTVTDTYNGLMWELKTDDGGDQDKDNAYTWQAALSYCENLSLADHTDWRLPDREELRSIVDYTKSYPSIDKDFFANTQTNGIYWSSTTFVFAENDNAWGIVFTIGKDKRDCDKLVSYYVRAVRTIIPDLTQDGVLGLDDAIIALKVLTGIDTTGKIPDNFPATGMDIGADEQIGLEEVVFILRYIAGL